MGHGFEEIVARFDPHVRELAVRARALIGDVYPEVVEVPWPGQNVVGYGVGPKKMSEHFRYVAFHRDHVNLGFNQGAELSDPEGLLGGPGKTLRHARSRRPRTSRTPPCAGCWRKPKTTGWRPGPVSLIPAVLAL